MSIKSFTFAFKLDAKELLAYVVERNIAVDIHATGTKREQPALLPVEEVQPLALPPPTHIRNSNTRSYDLTQNSRGVILAFLAIHPKESIPSTTFRDLLKQAGYSPGSVTSIIHVLTTTGLIKRSKPGHYRISAKGLRKMGAE